MSISQTVAKILEDNEALKKLRNSHIEQVTSNVRIIHSYKLWADGDLLDFIREDRMKLRNWGAKSEFIFNKSIEDFIQRIIKSDNQQTEQVSLEILKTYDYLGIKNFYLINYKNIWEKILSLNNGDTYIIQVANEIGIKLPLRYFSNKKIIDLKFKKSGDLFKIPSIGRQKVRSIIACLYWCSTGKKLTKNLAQINDLEELFVLAGLNKRQISILKLRYLGNRVQTLDSVGKILNVTRERIRQIEEKTCSLVKELGMCSIAKTWLMNNSQLIWNSLSTDGGFTVSGCESEISMNHRLIGKFQLGLRLADLHASDLLDEISDKVDDWWIQRGA